MGIYLFERLPRASTEFGDACNPIVPFRRILRSRGTGVPSRWTLWRFVGSRGPEVLRPDDCVSRRPSIGLECLAVSFREGSECLEAYLSGFERLEAFLRGTGVSRSLPRRVPNISRHVSSNPNVSTRLFEGPSRFEDSFHISRHPNVPRGPFEGPVRLEVSFRGTERFSRPTRFHRGS